MIKIDGARESTEIQCIGRVVPVIVREVTSAIVK